MDMFKTIIWEWRYVILLVLIFLVYSIVEWQKTKKVLYFLMLRAKSMAKDTILRSGIEQENWVVEKAYQFLPRRVIIFIPPDKMHKMVHYLYETAKDYVDDGIMNNSGSRP